MQKGYLDYETRFAAASILGTSNSKRGEEEIKEKERELYISLAFVKLMSRY